MTESSSSLQEEKVHHKVQPVSFLINNRSDGEESSSSRALLLNNLQQYGWSPISMLVVSNNNINNNNKRNNNNNSNNNKEKESSSSSRIILPPTKEAVLQVVMESAAKDNPRFTHRIAESGAKGGTMVEPKESLELKRMDAVVVMKTTGEEEEAQQSSSCSCSLVDEWCWAMSEIAQSVSNLLELPENTLLVNHNHNNDSNSKQEQHKNNNHHCLDLMRVFSYHQTPDGPQLGSSPHTDWGSWTIVWQDNVGGLETYSREHQQWEPVPTAAVVATSEESSNAIMNSAASVWHCIVHVGDMASLALQPSLPSNSNKAASTTSYYGWPSPEHRVQTSTTQKRASLVYFGYPPANTSIHEIRQRLKDWKPSCRGLQPLPLTAYYLLQNQSSSSNNNNNDNNADDDSNNHANQEERQLQEYYESLQKLSIQEVIQAKWNQVQRTNPNY